MPTKASGGAVIWAMRSTMPREDSVAWRFWGGVVCLGLPAADALTTDAAALT